MYQKTELESGLRIISEQLPHTKIVSVGIWVRAGSRDESSQISGTAHFVEHMLFKGTPSRSAQQLARELDVLGGAANAFTSRETTCYHTTVLDTHLPKAVELLADIFLHSLFDEEEVVKERQVILQEISMVEDTPDDQVHDLFVSQLWGQHPLGKAVLGSRDVVAAMDVDILQEFVRKFYTPDRVLIAAAGNVDHNALVDLIGRHFSSFGKRESTRGCEQKPPAACGQLVLHQDKPLEQVHVVTGINGLADGAAERYAMHLLHVVLGGNMSSRLFQEIRENRGLVYSIYSYISSYFDSGYLGIYFGAEKDSVRETLELIAASVASLSEEEIPAVELSNAKEFVKAGLYLSVDNIDSVMMRIARNEFTFQRYFFLDEIVTAIDRVDSAEIATLARRLFMGREFPVVALGPVEYADIVPVSIGKK